MSAKIGLWIGALVLVVAFGQWLAFRSAVALHHRAIRDRTLEPGIALALAAVRRADGHIELPPDLAASDGWALALYDARGTMLARTHSSFAIPEHLAPALLARAAASAGTAQHIEEPAPNSDTAVVVAIPDAAPGEPRFVGLFEVASQAAWAEVRAGSLTRTAILLTLAALVGTLAFAGRIHRRIRRAREVVRRIADGELDVRLPVHAHDEIGELARDFNRMADRLAGLVASLRDEEARKRRVIAAFTHELNTPLTSVLGYLESLRMPEVDAHEGTRRRYLEVAYEQARALGALASDVETLSRLDLEGLPLERREHDLAEIARREANAMVPRAQPRGVTIEVEGEARADVDRLRLGQVLRNLIDNAVRHSPEGAAVRVRMSEHGATAQLEVSDTGGGIAAEHLARLGEPLYRVDPSRTRGTGGRGLGLAIARALVQAHGGTLSIESDVGRGTTVRVALPARA